MINTLFYIISFLFSFGQLGRISFYNQQINFYLYEVFLGLFILVLFFKYRLEPLKEVWKRYKAVFLFLTILVLSLVNGFNKYSFFENGVAFLYLVRLIFYGGFVGFVGYEVKENSNFKKTLRNGILIITIMTIVTTITQYLLYPDLRNLFYQGWDPHLFRTFGVFFDTAIAGSIYGLILLTNTNLFVKAIFLFFLILSFSRGVYLGLLIAIIYLFLRKGEYKKLFLYLSIFLVFLFLAPKPTGEGVNLVRIFSIVSRLNDYKEGISLFLKKPILGYGYNRLRYVRNIQDSHAGASFSSSYLTIFVSSGILGLLGILGVLGKIWTSKKKFQPLLLFLVVVSIADNILLHPFILFLGGLLFILSDS